MQVHVVAFIYIYGEEIGDHVAMPIIGFSAGRILTAEQVDTFSKLDPDKKMLAARVMLPVIAQQKVLTLGKMTSTDTIPLQHAWAGKKKLDDLMLLVSAETGGESVGVELQGLLVNSVYVITVGLLQFDIVTLTADWATSTYSPSWLYQPSPAPRKGSGWRYRGYRGDPRTGYGGYRGYRGY